MVLVRVAGAQKVALAVGSKITSSESGGAVSSAAKYTAAKYELQRVEKG